MEVFYRSLTKSPQTYQEVVEDGVLRAVVYCPDCGSPIVLTKRYRIEPTGKVVPAICCTFPGCLFRDFSQLESWHRTRAQYVH